MDRYLRQEGGWFLKVISVVLVLVLTFSPSPASASCFGWCGFDDDQDAPGASYEEHAPDPIRHRAGWNNHSGYDSDWTVDYIMMWSQGAIEYFRTHPEINLVHEVSTPDNS